MRNYFADCNLMTAQDRRRRTIPFRRPRGSVLLLVGIVSASIAAGARADVYTDTFETGNPSAWAFIRGGDTIETTGGNPGRWLHQEFYDTFGPSLETFPGISTAFHGDYRANGVSRISLDARVDYTDFGSDGFELTLILRNTNGTPFDIADDDYAYHVGPFVPPEGQGWFHYDFDVPSQSNDDVPAGWKGAWLEDCENFRPGVTWPDLMSNIDQVEFWFIDPCLFAIFQRWDVGADNISIEFAGDPAPVEDPILVSAGWKLTASPSPASGVVRLEYALSGTPNTSTDFVSGSSPGSLPNAWATDERVAIDIFDVSGRTVARFAVTGSTGAVEWDGTDASGTRVAPGVYLARVSFGGASTSTRIAIVR
jgi:hypothetical protein